ncbi:MAG: TauD/TfdA family dioxygenase [Gammaproteobacteria bacterium]|nr:TauD/TfdA family dioxygenase [Gammaproteobacteria bacterium]
MNISKLSDKSGVQVSGIDVSHDLHDDDISKIVSLLYEHGVVCIRDQQIQPEELANFGARFGSPVEHNEENLRLNGLSTVMSLSNADDRDDRQLNGGAHWHTDLIHTNEPASFTMLHAVAVPPSGGGTLFANQILAYQALPIELEEKIRERVVIHCYEGRTDGSMPEILHSLIRKHPVTGKTALYGAADTGIGIVDMEAVEAMKLYLEIGEFATQDKFVYRHQYQLNDLVIWDNAQLLHSAEVLTRANSKQEQRIMHRVSVRGWPETD